MISAVIIARNEEKNIKDCIQSVAWCDEIIVIDDGSTDKTAVIADKNGVNVIKRSLSDDFSAQRNFGLEKAKGDWILFVDADERVSSALWYEIMEKTTNQLDSVAGYFIKRVDNLWGKDLSHGETGNIKLLRLAKRNTGKWKGKVHETWEVRGKKEVLNNFLNHRPHQSVAEFLKEINYYSSIRAKELHAQNVKVNLLSIILYPKAKFIKNYFFLGGFMDGLPGFLHAMLMSMHSFLVRGKLWRYQDK